MNADGSLCDPLHHVLFHTSLPGGKGLETSALDQRSVSRAQWDIQMIIPFVNFSSPNSPLHALPFYMCLWSFSDFVGTEEFFQRKCKEHHSIKNTKVVLFWLKQGGDAEGSELCSLALLLSPCKPPAL